MSSSRPTASSKSSIKNKLASAFGIAAALLGFAVSPALAAGPGKQAPAKVDAELAVCPGQTFSQPFEAFKDNNYYTLVEGSEFDEGAQGWQLENGAQIVEDGPEGGSGHALDLPSGSEAVSPPVCVTLQYPTARVWVRNAHGGGGVTVSVAYTGTKTETKPQNVGQVHSDHEEWKLSNPINVQPQIAGSKEEVREVRFHFSAGGGNNDYRLSGLYVDPRMR
jgi:hypothetical protein